MFGTKFMIRANDRPLEKRPDTLYGVGVNIAPYPFLGTMVDCLMPCIMVSDTIVSRPFIGKDSFGIRCGMFSDKLVKRFAPIIINHLKSNLTATLGSLYNGRLQSYN